MRLSIIIPSCGRSTLENTVNGLLPQLQYDDEIIVVGPRPPEVWHCELTASKYLRHRLVFNGGCHPDNSSASAAPGALHGVRGSRCGGEEKDLGFAGALGSHILTIDDDDIFRVDALELARAAISEHPDKLHIFRMQYGIEDQWRSHLARMDMFTGRWEMGFEDIGLVEGNIGGSMYIYPRIEDAPTHTREIPGGEDYHTFMAYVERLGPPIWHTQVWSIIRPSEQDLMYHVGPEHAAPKYTPQPLWMLPMTPERRARIEQIALWRRYGGAGEPPEDWNGRP